MDDRGIVEIPLDVLQFRHVADRRLALVDHQRVIEVHGKRDKDHEHGYDDDGAGRGRGERVVPELDPTEYGHLDEEEKEPEDRGEGPGELDEAAHALVRRLGHQPGHLELGDGLDVGQQVGADHEGEYVDRDEDGRADGEHDEEPLRHRRWLVDLELHHGDLQISGAFTRWIWWRDGRKWALGVGCNVDGEDSRGALRNMNCSNEKRDARVHFLG